MKTTHKIKGNVAKRDAYALAHQMMKDAIEKECPLQAITIEESILSDRLWSTLNVGRTVSATEFKNMTLGKALREWRPGSKVRESKGNPNRMRFDEEMNECYLELSQWWTDRCELLHEIAKSLQGEGPKVPAKIFLKRAMDVAIVGSTLVRIVENWTAKQIRRNRSTEKCNMKGTK